MNLNFVFSRNFLFLFIILVAFIVFFHRLGEAPLSGDGIGYGEIAKEMSLSGDYLTPNHDGVPVFYTSKPPFLYWMMAFSGNIFGFNDFSVKLPVAILAFLSIIIMFLFVNKYYDYNTAFFTSIILIFTQQYMHHGRSCVTDGPFAAFFMFALIAFWIALSENKNIYYYLMSAFIGCAIMTKQASGLFIYFVIFSYILSARDFSPLKNYHFYLSFLLVSLIVLPWHLIMYDKFGMEFIKEYFCATINNVQGWSSSVSDSNYEISAAKYNFFHEWYVYLQLLVNNYWPWLPFFVYGVYVKFINVKTIFVNKNKRDIFILTWIFIPFIILQVASKKNGNYLNPLYPAFALVCAEVFMSFSLKNIKKTIVILICTSAFLCIIYLLFPIIPGSLDAQKLKDPVLLIPTVKSLDKTKKIIIRDEDQFVFSSMFLFYADRGNITVNDKNFENEIDTGNKKYFASYKDNFMNILLNKYKDKIKILAETKKTVLFVN